MRSRGDYAPLGNQGAHNLKGIGSHKFRRAAAVIAPAEPIRPIDAPNNFYE